MAGAERQLEEAVDRALRNAEGKIAIVLHLSRLLSPRDHHVRVARVLLDDTARRHAGQVFPLPNHDLVLLCSIPDPNQVCPRHSPTALPASLDELFGEDAPAGGGLTSIWRLEQEAAQLRAYLDLRAKEIGLPEIRATAPDETVSLVALEKIIQAAPLTGLMRQHTGMCLSDDRHRTLASRLAPAYQKITIDLRPLHLDPLVGQAASDPFLFRHLCETLDRRLMQQLHDDLACRGRILRSALRRGVPVLIELGVRAIVSPDFATLSRAGALAGLRFGVAVSLLEAAADLPLLDHARGVLEVAGAFLVVNRVDPAVIDLVDPAALQSDFMDLPWSPQLRQAMRSPSQHVRLRRGVRPRVILNGVDGEQAIAWGQAHGIDLFDGPFLDQIGAATRMQTCHSASGCTLGQCLSRAAAIGLPGRVGCANPALLEDGLTGRQTLVRPMEGVVP